MSSIITSVSSIESHISDTVNNYKQIAEIAQIALSHMGKMNLFVEEEKNRLKVQIMNLENLEQILSRKKENLIYSLDNNHNRDKYEFVIQLQRKISQRKDDLHQLLNALFTMIDLLQKNSFEVKNIISVLEEEMDYNIQSLNATFVQLKSYLTVNPFSIYGVSSMNSDTSSDTSNGLSRRVRTQNKKAYKLKNGSFGYDSEGNRHLYKYYFTQTQPVKNMLFDIMKFIRPSIREGIMKHLDGVIFLSAKHGFNYCHNSNGRFIRIIGIDFTDPSFTHHLLIHIGHNLFEMEKEREKLALENRISLETAEKLKSADLKIRKMALDFTSANKNKSVYKSYKTSSNSVSSEFFAQCFRAYIEKDDDFLAAVKSNFVESYDEFMKIILKLSDT